MSAVLDERPDTAGDPRLGAWAILVQALPDAAWLVGLPQRRVRAANAAATALLALPADEIVGARADQLLVTPEDLAYWAAWDDPGGAGAVPSPLISDTVLHRVDGRLLHVRRTVTPVDARHALVTVVDTTAAHHGEQAHEDTRAELQATLEATADGILVTDLAGGIRAFNRRFAQIWGLPVELLERRDDDAVFEWMSQVVLDREAYRKRLQALHEASLAADTERVELVGGQILERVVRPLWSRGRPLGRVYSFRDLSERIAADARIESLTRSDALTGLPNRNGFAAEVERALLAIRCNGDAFAVLLVDLDRFSQVNESLGHAGGDAVLREVCTRLRRCLRGADIVARTGGDQFALLLRDADAPAAERAAQRVLREIARPWQCERMSFTLTCSVGIALAPGHGLLPDELLRHAESAMRLAKRDGSNALAYYQPQRESDLRAHMQLDHVMRQALAAGRFRLHYQPQVALADGRVVGVEALIRWRDPALGDVPPGRFIPVAEQTGFVVAIGDWVLGEAVRQAAVWQAGGRTLSVAINVSALQFRQPQFVGRVAAVLRESGLNPRLLELELTESILLHDADEALARLRQLASLGVRLAIDDFGTGYSSLAYLKRFPIGKLKIDRSFVKGLPNDASDAAIVRAIVQMAQALEMGVIAEGVETEPQLAFLREAGCAEFQGFLFAPALDTQSLEQRLG